MPAKAAYDKRRFSRVIAEQFGMISWGQALECGFSPDRVKYLIREGGPWRRVLPGVYATSTGTLTGNQRAMAALLHAGPGGVITGREAVGRHGLRCAGLNEIDVLVPSKTRVLSKDFAHITRTKQMPADSYQTGRIRFAGVARSVADAARRMSRLSDVRAVVAEAVQHGRCDVESLIKELNDGPAAGSAFLRQALGEITIGIRSAAEADLKDIIDASDLEEPMYNPELYAVDGTLIGIPDAWWGRAGVAAEVDSLQYHASPKDYEETVARHNRMQREDINLLHFLPRTLKQESGTVLADLRGAIAKGSARPPLPIVAIPAPGLLR
jgi:hypothetical protein